MGFVSPLFLDWFKLIRELNVINFKWPKFLRDEIPKIGTTSPKWIFWRVRPINHYLFFCVSEHAANGKTHQWHGSWL
jgi:hypothetical protein